MSIKKLLGLSLIFLLLGCTSENKQENNKQENVINVGAILSLTGKGAALGEYAKLGLELAVEEIHQKKNGLKINLIIDDSQSEGKHGVTAVNRMLGKHKKIDMLYVQLSAVSLPVKPIAEKNKIPMVALSGADDLLKESKYTFRNWVSPKVVSKQISDLMIEQFNLEKIGIFYSNDDYGASLNEEVSKSLKSKSVEVLFNSQFDDTKIDFRNQIQKQLKGHSPEYIYVVGIGKSLGILIKQIRESGFTGQIIGDTTISLPDVKEAAGDAIKGISYLDFGFDPEMKDNEFIVNFQNKFGRAPKTLSALSYDALNLFVTASSKEGDVISNLNRIRDFEGSFGKLEVLNYEIVYPLSFKKFE